MYNSLTDSVSRMYLTSLFLSSVWWLWFISSFFYPHSDADTFHIVTSQDTLCPGALSGIPCVSLQQYVSNPSIHTGNITLLFQTGNHTLASIFSASSASSYTLTGEDVNIECVSSAAQWNFLSVQQVYMRGISFFRCHGGMTFRNMEVLTMENIKIYYSYVVSSVTNKAPITLTDVAQVYVIRSDCSNNNNNNYPNDGGVFTVRNSSIEISGSIFHNNWAFSGGVIFLNDHVIGTPLNRIIIYNSTFTYNRAEYGNGGVISIFHSNSSTYYSVLLSISDSYFDNNRAQHNGGAVYYLGDKEMNITHSVFTNSYANFYGAAIFSRPSVTIMYSNFSGNNASQYGGAIISLSSITAMHCNFSSNIRGAIVSLSSVTLDKCTVVDNIGGIYSLSSVRVTHCNISNNIGYQGGAIHSESSVTAICCNITKNTASQQGGAIYSNFSVTVLHCTISKNTADKQGGALYSGSSVRALYTSFSDNRARTQGGAIYSGSELTCKCSEFLNNSAADGGAVFVNNNSSFTSCEFYDNTAQNFGGAIHITGTNSSTSVLDGIFVNNTAVTLGGGAIYSNSRYSNVSISSSTFTHNTASYCSVLDVDEYYHFNVSITDSTFTSNTATGALLGGGVACIRNASVTIRGSAFRHNHALLHGGVFQIDECHVVLDESIFLNNSATANGGVFYTYLHPSAYEVRRSEFSYNSAGEDGSVLYIGRVNSRVTISQCVFTYNEASTRGGMAALIGSSLYLDVNRTHIFNNTA